MFQDEAVFYQSGSLYRHWALRGVGAEVKSFPSRKNAKVMGALAVGHDPKWHFRFVEQFNSAAFITFLQQLIRRYKSRKIHLIVDNAAYHKTFPVRRWLDEHGERLELHFLPPYSPELNAAEFVWRETKRKATHNRYFKTLEELKRKLSRRFNRFQGNPASLRKVAASFI